MKLNLYFPKVSPKRRAVRAFLLMEILLSLGLFATVATAASIPHYKLKQILYKHYLSLESRRLSLLCLVIEHDPKKFSQKWPYWESVDESSFSKEGATEALSLYPFEEKGLEEWSLQSTSFIAQQMPKRGSLQYPVWRRYIHSTHTLSYRQKEVAAYEYGYSLMSVKKTKEEASGKGAFE